MLWRFQNLEDPFVHMDTLKTFFHIFLRILSTHNSCQYVMPDQFMSEHYVRSNMHTKKEMQGLIPVASNLPAVHSLNWLVTSFLS